MNDLGSLSLGLISLSSLTQPGIEAIICLARKSCIFRCTKSWIFGAFIRVNGRIFEFESMVQMGIVGLFLNKLLIVENDCVSFILKVVGRIFLHERDLATMSLGELQGLIVRSVCQRTIAQRQSVEFWKSKRKLWSFIVQFAHWLGFGGYAASVPHDLLLYHWIILNFVFLIALMVPIIGSILIVIFHQKRFLKVNVLMTFFLIIFCQNLQGIPCSQHTCTSLRLLIWFNADCGELFVCEEGTIGVCSVLIILFPSIDAGVEVLKFGKGKILLLRGHLVVGLDELMEALLVWPRFIKIVWANRHIILRWVFLFKWRLRAPHQPSIFKLIHIERSQTLRQLIMLKPSHNFLVLRQLVNFFWKGPILPQELWFAFHVFIILLRIQKPHAFKLVMLHDFISLHVWQSFASSQEGLLVISPFLKSSLITGQTIIGTLKTLSSQHHIRLISRFFCYLSKMFGLVLFGRSSDDALLALFRWPSNNRNGGFVGAKLNYAGSLFAKSYLLVFRWVTLHACLIHLFQDMHFHSKNLFVRLLSTLRRFAHFGQLWHLFCKLFRIYLKTIFFLICGIRLVFLRIRSGCNVRIFSVTGIFKSVRISKSKLYLKMGSLGMILVVAIINWLLIRKWLQWRLLGIWIILINRAFQWFLGNFL